LTTLQIEMHVRRVRFERELRQEMPLGRGSLGAG